MHRIETERFIAFDLSIISFSTGFRCKDHELFIPILAKLEVGYISEGKDDVDCLERRLGSLVYPFSDVGKLSNKPRIFLQFRIPVQETRHQFFPCGERLAHHEVGPRDCLAYQVTTSWLCKESFQCRQIPFTCRHNSVPIDIILKATPLAFFIWKNDNRFDIRRPFMQANGKVAAVTATEWVDVHCSYHSSTSVAKEKDMPECNNSSILRWVLFTRGEFAFPNKKCKGFTVSINANELIVKSQFPWLNFLSPHNCIHILN